MQQPDRGYRTKVCPFALVLAPTRELATQIFEEASKVFFLKPCQANCCSVFVQELPLILIQIQINVSFATAPDSAQWWFTVVTTFGINCETSSVAVMFWSPLLVVW